MVVRSPVKFLGGLLAALLILGIILGAVGYFAVRDFDPNMFRTEFEKYLTQQTGFRVELGDIKLQWRPQPQLRVGGLKFYHFQTLEKILQSDQVRIDADLTSIWQKHFSMSQVLIQSPEIFLKRDRGGGWNWQAGKGSATPIPAPAVAPMSSQADLMIPTSKVSEGGAEAISLKSLGGVIQGWEFGIGKILVQDATVHFVDETVQPDYRLEVEKLEVEVRQKTINASYHFTAGAIVFNATKRNLETEGDLDLVSKSLDLVLRYGPEKAVFKGMIKVINTMPHFDGTLEVRDLDMESVIPAVYKKGDYVAGRLSAKAQLAFDGANPAIIKHSLKGQGTVEVRDGALRNRNLIKEVFDRLSSVIAITSALGGELPPEVNEMLKDRDTPFQSLQVVCGVQAGIVTISEFRLVHPNYQLAGQGTYGILDNRVEGSMQLLFSESISAYLMKKIREMELIADRSGQIMIPFRYSGVFPDAVVQPDLPYIASRLLQGGADQLINRGLGRLSKIWGPKKTAETSDVATAPSSGAGPASGTSTAQTDGKISAKEARIRAGLGLLSQILGPEKK